MKLTFLFHLCVIVFFTMPMDSICLHELVHCHFHEFHPSLLHSNFIISQYYISLPLLHWFYFHCTHSISCTFILHSKTFGIRMKIKNITQYYYNFTINSVQKCYMCWLLWPDSITLNQQHRGLLSQSVICTSVIHIHLYRDMCCFLGTMKIQVSFMFFKSCASTYKVLMSIIIHPWNGLIWWKLFFPKDLTTARRNE